MCSDYLLGRWRSALWRGNYQESLLGQVLDALHRIQTEWTKIHFEHDLWAGSERIAWQVSSHLDVRLVDTNTTLLFQLHMNVKYIYSLHLRLDVTETSSFVYSYKLWYNYLRERRKQVKGKCITDPGYEEVNNCHERALVFMHKVLNGTLYNTIIQYNTLQIHNRK